MRHRLKVEEDPSPIIALLEILLAKDPGRRRNCRLASGIAEFERDPIWKRTSAGALRLAACGLILHHFASGCARRRMTINIFWLLYDHNVNLVCIAQSNLPRALDRKHRLGMLRFRSRYGSALGDE